MPVAHEFCLLPPSHAQICRGALSPSSWAPKGMVLSTAKYSLRIPRNLLKEAGIWAGNLVSSLNTCHGELLVTCGSKQAKEENLWIADETSQYELCSSLVFFPWWLASSHLCWNHFPGDPVLLVFISMAKKMFISLLFGFSTKLFTFLLLQRAEPFFDK